MKTLYLYLISRPTETNYDTYEGAVVAAENEEDARLIHPNGNDEPEWWKKMQGWEHMWIQPETVIVEYLGEAIRGTKRGVILASYHAG